MVNEEGVPERQRERPEFALKYISQRISPERKELFWSVFPKGQVSEIYTIKPQLNLGCGIKL